MEDQVTAMLRSDLIEIFMDTAFLVLGLESCAIAGIRRQKGTRVFLWMGIWSFTYGLVHVLEVRAVVEVLPASLQAVRPWVIVVILYMTVVIAVLAWLELVVGAIRRILIGFLVVSFAIGVAGIASFALTGSNDKFMRFNNAAAACILSMQLVILINKRLFKKYLLLPVRGFLVVGTVLFSVEALFNNLTRHFVPLRTPIIYDHLGFMFLLLAFGYSALKMVQLNERRLLEIHAELEVARQIQASILPTSVPNIPGLRICATYRPMASVAGDFYEFLSINGTSAGFFVADVCGHGVPAALIASMLKVAVGSVASCAEHPGAFLRGLNRVLAEPLRGQLVSAAYFWMDLPLGRARYSAAGHPPLLRCNGNVEQIESNGLPFGVFSGTDYPETEFPLSRGDRFILYTDGISESQNDAGEFFGDAELQRVLQVNRNSNPEALSRNLLSEIERWQPATQDDITFIVIDVC